MKIQTLTLILALCACAEDAQLFKVKSVCPDGVTSVDSIEDCPIVPAPTTVIQTACSDDGRIVENALECIRPPVTCPDGSTAPTSADCLPQTKTTTVTVREYVCANGMLTPSPTGCPSDYRCFDGSRVTDPAQCQSMIFECPEGMNNADGACQCNAPGRYTLPQGISVDCPAPQVVTVHDYVCWNTAIVADPLLCPPSPTQGGPVYLCLDHGNVRVVPDSTSCNSASSCPLGSRLVDDACECPEGGTVILDNGRVITCPRYQLPDACNWLEVEDRTPDVLRIGRRMIGPSMWSPYFWRDPMPIIKFRLNTCEGQEIALGGTVFTATVSSGLAGQYTWTNAITVERRFYINGLVEVHSSGMFSPNFLYNNSRDQDGTERQDLTITGREIDVEVQWPAQLEPGTHTITIRGFQATRALDGEPVVPPQEIVLHKTIIITDDPCGWTNAPDVYFGNPQYLPETPAQHIQRNEYSIQPQPDVMNFCTRVVLDSVQYRIWDDTDYHQNPQIQHDLTGIWWGVQNDPVFQEGTAFLSTTNNAPTSHVGSWGYEQQYVDVQRFVSFPLEGREFAPGFNAVFTPSLTIHPSHPRSANATDHYTWHPDSIDGTRLDNSNRVTSIVMSRPQAFDVDL